ncbi:MAG: class I SAM-dependent methyltransferase [Bryobacteraceae bacterium]|nr:class I SAM-dependent methyltransferase [Bryobacteraceae bacterium]
MNPLKALARQTGNWYIRRLCSMEYRRQTFTHHNERPIEYGFALDCLAAERPKTVLDVGTGTTAWPHLLRNCGFIVTAIDNVRDYWRNQIVNRHWTVLDVDITEPSEFGGPFDAVTCISVIEHIVEHENAVRNMLALLAPGGLLIITTPYNHREHCPNVYKRTDALYGQDLPYICRSHSAREIEQWQRLGARLKRREMWRLFSGPVWATGRRVDWEQAESEDAPHQLGCFAFEKTIIEPRFPAPERTSA